MRHAKTNKDQDVERATLETLFSAAKEADRKGETATFLANLLTESEQLMLGRRLVISRMLLAGLPQREIRLRLHVSPNTIWKVGRWLEEQIPEYGMALKKVSKEMTARAAKRKVTAKRRPYRQYDPLSFAALKRKYPMHFLLFKLVDDIIDNEQR